MKVDPYLHAVLVLHGAGKEITKESLTSVLKAAGVEADDAKAKVLAEAVKGANFEELLKNATAPVAVAAPAAAAAPAAKKEEKKDEAKSEAAASEGLASLFG
ncbi:MAG TPA: 50S ribosomal protein P1 [Candidatus Micrarchaeota archaeon]|nr:50S ribosomal protein P1 [Candidatus Micrarchaeota archaeon]